MRYNVIDLRHAKRSTVTMEDVKLAARRSTALVSFSIFTIVCHSNLLTKCTLVASTHFSINIEGIYSTADVKCHISLYLFQSIYIQNKCDELNQEQKDVKKKSTGKRKSKDTEESRE